MSYAKVVLGLPLEGPFDYIIPLSLKGKVKAGVRVRVSFGFKKLTGYVVGVCAKTEIKKLKPILEVIDDAPILNENMLSLAQEVSDYYCCSWGEAIDAVLPLAIRKGSRLPQINAAAGIRTEFVSEPLFLQAPQPQHRYERYILEISKELESGKSAIVVLPDTNSVMEFKGLAEKGLKIPVSVLHRNEPQELDEWLKIKSGMSKLAVGTRAAIFAPFSDLGLIIVDEENNPNFKQEQVPHYHAREAAFMRSKIDKTRLILGAVSPSLECRFKINKKELSFEDISPGLPEPEVRAIDMKFESRKGGNKSLVFSKYLVDSINSSLSVNEKVLLFLNRKGFATYSFCHNCKAPLVCPRCNVSLSYYFEENILSCNHCNFKMPVPEICPKCNAGYIKFRGAGTEKLESEIARVFPQAQIGRDIFISTSAIFKQIGLKFSLVCVLNIDNSLSRPDFRSTEKVFDSLLKLKASAEKKLIIQTASPTNPLFTSLQKNEPDIFYKDELKQRKQLKLPPYKHLALISVRSKIEDKTRACALSLFEKLKSGQVKGIEVISVNTGVMPKLRGNFYWQVLLRSPEAKKAARFIKNKLKDFRHSGIIVSIDIDPV
ncbi:MAG: primosomal protein N' [Candidatus Omnitrophota bacterium]|jgi:primosomal protein N' (replication factor Y)